MSDEMATLTYWQLKAYLWDGTEYLVEVYDDPKEALHHFHRVMAREDIPMRRGCVIYYDGDFCKTIAQFDFFGLGDNEELLK